MAATILWDGFGRVDNADSTTGWAALKISGTGGAPSVAAADGSFEGSGAVTATTSKQRIALYFDIGAGSELDFSGGGTEENELIYMWASFLAPGLLLNQSAGGFGIFLETLTPTITQYHLYYFYGADNYKGGFKRLILDPTKTVSASAGTALNLASVRYFGVFADVGGATARFDNLICDAIDVGVGLRVYDTSTTDDLVGDLLADEATNRYGIVTSLNDPDSAIGLAGQLKLGDDSSTNAAAITDINSKFFVEEPLYYETTEKASAPLTYASIRCVGNGTGATSITIGKAVGSDSGRSGWSITGNDTYTVDIDWDDGNVNTNLWYGCSFENLTGTLAWGTNTAHELFSSSFSGCEQFDPVGGIQIKNCNFLTVYDDGVADASNRSALLWNSSIDIQNCNFLANSHSSSDVAHGIEHNTVPGVAWGTNDTLDVTGVTLEDTGASFLSTADVNDIAYNERTNAYATVTSVPDNTHVVMSAGLENGSPDDEWQVTDDYSVTPPITYTNLNFSGNEKDVHNSTAGPDALVISKAGTANPSTSTGIAVFQGSVTITITVTDTATDPIETAQASVYLTSDDSEIINTLTNPSGIASGSFPGATPAACYVRVRKSTTGDTRYIPFSTAATIASSSGLNLGVTLVVDTNA